MTVSFSATSVVGGLQNPVLDAQHLFRRIMGAFAEPGLMVDLGGFVAPPTALPSAAAALLATLSDADAPVFLDIPDEDGAAAAWIGFQTGAPILAAPDGAAFAVLALGSDPESWDRFAVGTDAFPDRSATLLLPVATLEGGSPLVLSGPGIEATRVVSPRGLPTGFLAARARNAALFPRGQDLVLVAENELIALPRTTRIEER